MKEQQLKNIELRQSKSNFRSFLENQIRQRKQQEETAKEQARHDFNQMMNTTFNNEKKDQFNKQMKKKHYIGIYSYEHLAYLFC